MIESKFPIKVEDRELLTLGTGMQFAQNAMIHWTRMYQAASKAFWEKASELHEDVDISVKSYAWNHDEREIRDPFDKPKEE